MAQIVTCPSCAKAVPWTGASRWRPFCSQRCKLIDLGDWAAQRHVIAGSESAGPTTDLASDEQAQAASRQR